MHQTATTGDQVACLVPAGSGNSIFSAIDYEILSAVILSNPLIQEGQLSVSVNVNVHKYWLTA